MSQVYTQCPPYGLEFIKWFGFAVVTAWLTLAQIAAWRRRGRARAAENRHQNL